MKKFLLLLCCSMFIVTSADAQNRYNTPRVVKPENTYISQHVDLPLKELESVLREKQAAYEMSIKECRNQVVELYNSASNYPDIKDGKHSVTLTGNDACTETHVIVDKGRVFSMPMNNGYITNFTISTPIKNGLSKIGIPDAETGITRYYDVVFLSDIFAQ